MGGEQKKSKGARSADGEVSVVPKLSTLQRVSLVPPSAKNCKPYVRKRLAKALPEIANVLIDKAQQGGLAELKMLVKMSGLDDRVAQGTEAKRRGKTLKEMLMEDWRKEPLDEPIG